MLCASVPNRLDSCMMLWYTWYGISSESWIFLGMFRFKTNIKCLLRERTHCIFKVFPGHFKRIHGPSLVELMGYNINATLAVTIQIRMSPKGVYGHRIQQSMDQPGKVAILLVIS